MGKLAFSSANPLYQQLMDDIWGYDSDSDTHTVDVHIGRLRDRFKDNTDFKIVTIRGVGYKVVKQ